jgi:hypothetical protein
MRSDGAYGMYIYIYTTYMAWHGTGARVAEIEAKMPLACASSEISARTHVLDRKGLGKLKPYSVQVKRALSVPTHVWHGFSCS